MREDAVVNCIHKQGGDQGVRSWRGYMRQKEEPVTPYRMQPKLSQQKPSYIHLNMILPGTTASSTLTSPSNTASGTLSTGDIAASISPLNPLGGEVAVDIELGGLWRDDLDL